MTRSRLLGLAVGAGALVLTASAANAEEIPVSGPTTYTVTGHGWGHGHGLSQYGAKGAAGQGVGWKQILGFYYPGTGLGRVRGTVSVLITADTSKDVMVDARDGLRLRPLTGTKSFVLDKLRPRATRWRILPKGTRSVVQFKARSGGWTTWTAVPGEAEFTAGSKPVTLRLPGHATASYRGSLRSVEKHTVNVLPLDRYVRGVVPREVPTSWPADAIRAQAVAARTYAAYERATATTYYDLCDTSSCQVYGGADAEDPAATAAVRATSGRVVTYQGQPAFTQFSSSNGGWSSAGSQPYLVAQPDPYEAASGNPYASWSTTLTSAQIQQTWPQIGTLTAISLTRDGNGDFGGRVTKAVFTGTSGIVTVTGDDVRSLMGDAGRSTWFRLT
ncbi:MAG: stage sporulation protein, partial [Actinomycetota bacterium]|nr:stage sporulation protein [Actinomycetota bacterium]